MKLLSWNVAGLRAVLSKGFMKSVLKHEPDILLLQETKVSSDFQINLAGYRQYWSYAEKKGYSGTAIFSKIKPLSAANVVGAREHDTEGRVITLEFEKYYLVNVYTPNSGRELPRLPYRQVWDKEFLSFLLKLEKKKPVIVGGDFNVAHREIDLANPKENRRNAGFTDEERSGFSRLIDSGFVDSLREFHKEPGLYTYWGMWNNLRARNIGWRVDYFLVSRKLRPLLKDAFTLPEVMGSDHCPVGIEISL